MIKMTKNYMNYMQNKPALPANYWNLLYFIFLLFTYISIHDSLFCFIFFLFILLRFQDSDNSGYWGGKGYSMEAVYRSVAVRSIIQC